MLDTFKVLVLYGQLAVFGNDVAEPFNDWTQDHMRQGFSWRPETVSFSTLRDGGTAAVSVEVRDTFEPRPDAERALRVPFEVPAGRAIEVASISDGQVVDIPAGRYALVFETGVSGVDDMWVRLTFWRGGPEEPAVLIADGYLDPPDPLIMTAEPA